MKIDTKYKWIIKAISSYFTFFFLVAFVITCCMMLFVTALSESLGITLTGDNLGVAAKQTFWNVMLISLILTVIDTVRRKLTLGRPVKQITRAAEEMIHGNFNVKIKPISKLFIDERFNEIIECINKMAEELSSVEMLRTDFIANVSHEMKTPLAVIQNYGTLLQTVELSDEKRTEYARAMTEASSRLSSMMTNILKLNRLENQQIYPRAESYDLGEQLCECLLQYEGAWEQKGLEIETDIEENVIICADNELLSLVWNNLFSNAVKFTDDGGKITLSLKKDGENVIVSVKDTGCGIPPEVGAHIFEKFYQGDTSRATQGNGLGLALVRRVVDIMGADIEVNSVVGEGTEFIVRIKNTKNN